MNAESRSLLESILEKASKKRGRVHDEMIRASGAGFDLTKASGINDFIGGLLMNATEIFAASFKPGDRDAAGSILAAWVAEKVGTYSETEHTPGVDSGDR